MSSIAQIFKDHYDYRKQIFKLAKSDLIKTYRGAALGWAWAIIKPAFTIFVYWFTFSTGIRGAGKPVNGYPFFLFLISGVIPWFYMSDMLTAGTNSIRSYNYLVTKVNFPVSTIPTFVSISKYYVHLFLMAIMVTIFTLMGRVPDIYYLQLPFYMLFTFFFWTIFALLSSLLAALSKDYLNLIKSLITAIFWLSGILFDPMQHDGIFGQILMLNPVTYLTSGYRNVFIYKVWFFHQPKRMLYFFIILTLMTMFCLWAYKKLRKEIPDVL